MEASLFGLSRNTEKDQAHNDALSARAALHWMRQAVIGAYPSIGVPETSDFERVSLLREWAHQASLSATGPCSLEEIVPHIREEDAPSIFYRMARIEGGFLCGGISVALWKLYELFGYRAHNYNMGKTNVTADGRNGSHVVTLVHIEHKGRPVLSIQDASFNYTLVDRNGEPLSFGTLIELLIERRIDEVDIQEGKVLTWRHLCAEDPAPGDFPAEYVKGKQYLADGRVLISGEHRLSLLKEHMYFRYGQWIKDIVGDDNILYLFLFPLSSITESEIAAGVAAAKAHIDNLARKR